MKLNIKLLSFKFSPKYHYKILHMTCCVVLPCPKVCCNMTAVLFTCLRIAGASGSLSHCDDDLRHNLAIAEALWRINKVKTLPLDAQWLSLLSRHQLITWAQLTSGEFYMVAVRRHHHISSRLTILKRSGSCVSRLWPLRSWRIPILTLYA